MTTSASNLRMRRAARALGEIISRDGVPGAVAEARVHGEGCWQGAAGYSDPAAQAPRRTDEHFRAGSVTKIFVAAAALHLVAERRLRLSDPVTRWLPELPSRHGNRLGRITLGHLLGHTSGLFDYTRDPEMHRRLTTGFLDHRLTAYQPLDLVGMALEHAPGFAPGTGWSYSNTGYVLAGLMIERATGHDFRHEVMARVVEPLGLEHTHFPGGSADLPYPHARHYSRLSLPVPFHGTRDVTELNPSSCDASGELISTVSDLTRFLSTLLRGRLLPSRLLAEMLTPAPGSRGAHGLGIKFRRLPRGVVAGYDGAIHGSITSVYGTLDGCRTVALNVNSDWQDEAAMTATLMNAVLEEDQL